MDEITEEIADVTIMIEQLTILFGADKVQDQIDFKLNRLKERMNR